MVKCVCVVMAMEVMLHVTEVGAENSLERVTASKAVGSRVSPAEDIARVKLVKMMMRVEA